MPDRPTLLLNGEPHDFDRDAFPDTLARLVDLLGIDAVTVVAEVDGVVAERGRFAEVELAPGARVELVRFVGGG